MSDLVRHAPRFNTQQLNVREQVYKLSATRMTNMTRTTGFPKNARTLPTSWISCSSTFYSRCTGGTGITESPGERAPNRIIP